MNRIDSHQLKVARKTMRLSCVGTRVLGGPSHREAREVIRKLTGKIVVLDFNCSCECK